MKKNIQGDFQIYISVPLKYGWVGTNRTHFEKQFREIWSYVSYDGIIESLST